MNPCAWRGLIPERSQLLSEIAIIVAVEVYAVFRGVSDAVHEA